LGVGLDDEHGRDQQVGEDENLAEGERQGWDEEGRFPLVVWGGKLLMSKFEVFFVWFNGFEGLEGWSGYFEAWPCLAIVWFDVVEHF
jgi:hypothetical protein